MVHKSFFADNFHSFQNLLVARRAQSQNRKSFCLAAAKKARAVGPRQNPHFAGNFPYFVDFSAVWPFFFFDYIFMDNIVYLFFPANVTLLSFSRGRIFFFNRINKVLC